MQEAARKWGIIIMIKNKLKKIILTGIIAVTAFGLIGCGKDSKKTKEVNAVSYTHLRAHET